MRSSINHSVIQSSTLLRLSISGHGKETVERFRLEWPESHLYAALFHTFFKIHHIAKLIHVMYLVGKWVSKGIQPAPAQAANPPDVCGSLIES